MPEPDVTYKGFILIPHAVPDAGMYAAALTVLEPDGEKRDTELPGRFPCELAARSFAISFGMAEIDKRGCPDPEWTEAAHPDAVRSSTGVLGAYCPPSSSEDSRTALAFSAWFEKGLRLDKLERGRPSRK
jgi:hypothetical protein